MLCNFWLKKSIIKLLKPLNDLVMCSRDLQKLIGDILECFETFVRTLNACKSQNHIFSWFLRLKILTFCQIHFFEINFFWPKKNRGKFLQSTNPRGWRKCYRHTFRKTKHCIHTTSRTHSFKRSKRDLEKHYLRL